MTWASHAHRNVHSLIVGGPSHLLRLVPVLSRTFAGASALLCYHPWVEFISPDASATVRGANVKATLEALRKGPPLGRKLVSQHRLLSDELKPDNFLPVQRWLDALKDIQESIGEPALRQTGVGIVVNADFPPHFASVEAILLALNDIYYANHHGNVGRYVTEERADGAVVVHCETPYPRNFERGLIEGICRNRRAGGTLYCVEYQDGPAGHDRTCSLTIHRA